MTNRSFDASDLIETYPDYDDQLIHRDEVPATTSETVSVDEVLPPAISTELSVDLYSHQAEAIEVLKEDANVTVATSTASGKTWIYTLYFALQKLQNTDARGLFLYPTKALSSDQERSINDLLNDAGVDALAETYDGDTKAERKPQIRSNRDVIISNFSGLNYYLSDHTKWGEFYSDVELVVVDESHSYTGVQGMHVAWVLRRLQRVLSHYDADPQYVCSTATIGNPKAHSEALVGKEFSVIDEDGSPQGHRDIAFWQPPVEEEADDYDLDAPTPEIRKQANTELASLTAHLGLSGVQTLSFLRSRQGCEIAAKKSQRAASDHPIEDYLDVDPYHAGLGKKRRRAIENKLKSGDIDGVFSTNALELGIDIGSVDATVLGGYPGTRQSFWQQLGRAGRGTADALSVFIPRDDAMDQYILDNPSYLLEDDVEDAVVSLDNNSVYAKHVLCASNEIPIDSDDTELLGETSRLEQALSVWRDAGKLRGDLDIGAQYAGPPRPETQISMYSTTDTQYDVRCVGDGTIDIEPVQKERAYRDFHPGALFMHDGVQYEVEAIEEDRHQPVIEVTQVSTNEYTITSSDKRVHDVTKERTIRLSDDIALHAGMGTVDIAYTQYHRIPIYGGSGSTSGPHSIDLPPISLRTQLMWVELPDDIKTTVDEQLTAKQYISSSNEEDSDDLEWTFAGGLHGAEHGMIKLAPLELRLDNSDMGGLSTPYHAVTDGPTWFIHDAVEGGVGFAHSLFSNFEAVAEKTKNRVSNCDCQDITGCPSCLMSSQCGNNNEPLHIPTTRIILNQILETI